MYRRIKDFREERNLSQREVAEYLHMSQSGYSQYETKGRNIPIWALCRLATLYGTSVDYLLDITDEREPHGWRKDI